MPVKIGCVPVKPLLLTLLILGLLLSAGTIFKRSKSSNERLLGACISIALNLFLILATVKDNEMLLYVARIVLKIFMGILIIYMIAVPFIFAALLSHYSGLQYQNPVVTMIIIAEVLLLIELGYKILLHFLFTKLWRHAKGESVTGEQVLSV